MSIAGASAADCHKHAYFELFARAHMWKTFSYALMIAAHHSHNHGCTNATQRDQMIRAAQRASRNQPFRKPSGMRGAMSDR